MMFQTRDIVLAAALKVLGYELDNIIKQGNRGTFCFKNVPTEVVDSYDLGKLLIEPNSFNNAIKSLTTATRR